MLALVLTTVPLLNPGVVHPKESGTKRYKALHVFWAAAVPQLCAMRPPVSHKASRTRIEDPPVRSRAWPFLARSATSWPPEPAPQNNCFCGVLVACCLLACGLFWLWGEGCSNLAAYCACFRFGSVLLLCRVVVWVLVVA